MKRPDIESMKREADEETHYCQYVYDVRELSEYALELEAENSAQKEALRNCKCGTNSYPAINAGLASSE